MRFICPHKASDYMLIPSSNEVYFMTVQDASQRGINTTNMEFFAMFSISHGAGQPASSQQGKFNDSSGKPKKRHVCSYCHVESHIKEKCYKLHGYLPGHRFHKNQNKVPTGTSVNYRSVPNNVAIEPIISSEPIDLHIVKVNKDQLQRLMELLNTSEYQVNSSHLIWYQ